MSNSNSSDRGSKLQFELFIKSSLYYGLILFEIQRYILSILKLQPTVHRKLSSLMKIVHYSSDIVIR